MNGHSKGEQKTFVFKDSQVVIITFNPNKQPDWNLRVVVSFSPEPLKLDCRSWLFSLARAISTVTSSSLESLPITAKESEFRSLLADEVLKSGLAPCDDSKDRRAFASEIITTDTHNVLGRLMACTGSQKLAKFRCVTAALRAALGVAVFHRGLEEDIRRFLENPKENGSIGRSLGLWLRRFKEAITLKRHEFMLENEDQELVRSRVSLPMGGIDDVSESDVERSYEKIINPLLQKASLVMELHPSQASLQKIQSLLLCGAPLDDMKEALLRRRSRGIVRELGLKCVKRIIEDGWSPYISAQLLSQCRAKLEHFDCDLSGCDIVQREAVGKAFWSLLSSSSDILAAEETPVQTKLSLLPDFVFKYTSDDVERLFSSGILSQLSKIASTEENTGKPLSGVLQRQALHICRAVAHAAARDSREEVSSAQEFLVRSIVDRLVKSQEHSPCLPLLNSLVLMLMNQSVASHVGKLEDQSDHQLMRSAIAWICCTDTVMRCTAAHVFSRIAGVAIPSASLIERVFEHVFVHSSRMLTGTPPYPIVNMRDRPTATLVESPKESWRNVELVSHNPMSRLMMPLPSQLDSSRYQGYMVCDGCSLTSVCQTEDDDMASMIRANNTVPLAAPFYYFEVSILHALEPDVAIGIGLNHVDAVLRGMPGWEKGSYGWHSDDGKRYSGRRMGFGDPYGPSWGKGDTVGLLWNRTDKTVLFTKNGKLLPVAFRNVEDECFPVVGMKSMTAQVKVNFGQEPFIFDIVHQARKKGWFSYQPISSAPATSMYDSATKLLTLARLLMNMEKWKLPFHSQVEGALSKVRMLSSQTEVSEDHFLCLGVLGMLGGHIFGCSTGARVTVRSMGSRSGSGVVMRDMDNCKEVTVAMDSIVNAVSLRRSHVKLMPLMEYAPLPDFQLSRQQIGDLLHVAKTLKGNFTSRINVGKNQQLFWSLFSFHTMKALSFVLQSNEPSRNAIDDPLLHLLLDMATLPCPGKGRSTHLATLWRVVRSHQTLMGDIFEHQKKQNSSGPSLRQSQDLSLEFEVPEEDAEQYDSLPAAASAAIRSGMSPETFQSLVSLYMEIVPVEGQSMPMEYFRRCIDTFGLSASAAHLVDELFPASSTMTVSIAQFIHFFVRMHEESNKALEAGDVEDDNLKVHLGWGCDGCKTLPIKGIRMRCLQCHDFDLCWSCFWSEQYQKHEQDHTFVVLRDPLYDGVSDTPIHLQQFFYPSGQDGYYSSFYTGNASDTDGEHATYTCMTCGTTVKEPPYYVCGNCEEDCYICSSCFKPEDLAHDPKHVFLAIRKPNPTLPKKPILPMLYDEKEMISFADLRPGRIIAPHTVDDTPKGHGVKEMEALDNCKGIVLDKDEADRHVLIQFAERSGDLCEYWYPFRSVRQNRFYPTKQLHHRLEEAAYAFTLLSARRACAYLIGHISFSRFCTPQCSPGENLIRFLKLAGVERIGKAVQIGQSMRRRMPAEVREYLSKIDSFLKVGESDKANVFLSDDDDGGWEIDLPLSRSRREKDEVDDTSGLAVCLIEECMRQLEGSANEEERYHVEESTHPFRSAAAYHVLKGVTVPDGEGLLVVFDRRCELEPDSAMLQFSSRDSLRATSYSNSPILNGVGQKRWRAQIFSKNFLWYLFACNPGNGWGFRFTATPLSLRCSDHESLTESRSSFALFLLEWLLRWDKAVTKSLYQVVSRGIIALLLRY